MTREVYIGFSYPYLLTNQFYHQKKGFGIFTGDQLGTNVSRLQSINVLKINVILIMIKSIPLIFVVHVSNENCINNCVEMKLNV